MVVVGHVKLVIDHFIGVMTLPAGTPGTDQ